jgi:hypothetical protein
VREKLNDNPMAQVGLILVLVIAAVVIFIGQSGGGEEEEGEVASTEATVAVAGTSAVGTATGATPGEAVESAIETVGAAAPAAPAAVPTPPPPAPVIAAYDSGKTVVLLIVDDGGINDALVEESASQLTADPDVALFTVPAKQIAHYAAITVGLDVNRVPALVVMRPKRLSGGTPQASVDYGFQTAEGLVQAVRDAAYEGREVTYHPN